MKHMIHSEIIFTVIDDDAGGYVATAQGYGITTQADTLVELKHNVREAVHSFFDEDDPEHPALICLRFVREEVLTLK